MSKRSNKPRVLAEFDFCFGRARIVDRTRTEYSRDFRVIAEQSDGTDAMEATRWVDMRPRTFAYTSNGAQFELRYYKPEDVKQIVDALCRKLRARRRRAKKGGAA